jgi:hypothetical protein
LAINLKKLQSAGRRKLKLQGSVEWKLVSKSELPNQGIGKEYLSTRTIGSTHVISYFDVNSLEPVDVFHEMCRAKLNELGFVTIEMAALEAIRDCSKDDPKFIRDANSSVTIVQEALVNSLLFSQFPEESRAQRERMVLRFESSDALTTLHTQMGFWGTAGVSYYREASNRSKVPFPEEMISKAIGRASDGEAIRKEYDQINSVLDELPEINLDGSERLSEQDGMKILELMMRLFSAKTGLEC